MYQDTAEQLVFTGIPGKKVTAEGVWGRSGQALQLAIGECYRGMAMSFLDHDG